MPRRLPRCPYARAGLDESLISRCPAFVPADVVFEVTGIGGEVHTLEVAVARSCAHLGLQPSRIEFGFVTSCNLPEGPPPVATVQVVGRSVRARAQPDGLPEPVAAPSAAPGPAPLTAPA